MKIFRYISLIIIICIATYCCYHFFVLQRQAEVVAESDPYCVVNNDIQVAISFESMRQWGELDQNFWLRNKSEASNSILPYITHYVERIDNKRFGKGHFIVVLPTDTLYSDLISYKMGMGEQEYVNEWLQQFVSQGVSPIEIVHEGVMCNYYPTAQGSFLLSYFHKGIWVASFSIHSIYRSLVALSAKEQCVESDSTFVQSQRQCGMFADASLFVHIDDTTWIGCDVALKETKAVFTGYLPLSDSEAKLNLPDLFDPYLYPITTTTLQTSVPPSFPDTCRFVSKVDSLLAYSASERISIATIPVEEDSLCTLIQVVAMQCRTVADSENLELYYSQPNISFTPRWLPACYHISGEVYAQAYHQYILFSNSQQAIHNYLYRLNKGETLAQNMMVEKLSQELIEKASIVHLGSTTLSNNLYAWFSLLGFTEANFLYEENSQPATRYFQFTAVENKK